MCESYAIRGQRELYTFLNLVNCRYYVERALKVKTLLAKYMTSKNIPQCTEKFQPELPESTEPVYCCIFICGSNVNTCTHKFLNDVNKTCSYHVEMKNLVLERSNSFRFRISDEH